MEIKKEPYEIRLESVGGLGANLATKILGETGVNLGFNAAGFSSYGSEKRGSPVKGFIRYAKNETPLRINSPVETPDILAVFHDRLAGKHGVMAGVDENSIIIVNTTDSVEDTRRSFQIYAGTLCCIDALGIAMELKTRVNMVMIGAIAAASGFLTVDAISEALEGSLGKKYPKSMEGNIKGIKAGYENYTGIMLEKLDGYTYHKYSEIERAWGYDNAPIGGVNPIFGSSITNNLSASREGYIPVFNKELCIRCGLCDTTCPDMVFQFVRSDNGIENLGPDYNYCKGCMRCVEICPTKALSFGYEREHNLSKTQVDYLGVLTERIGYDDVGANSWVNSESYTTNSLD